VLNEDDEIEEAVPPLSGLSISTNPNPAFYSLMLEMS
jgi:hypothetical protein